MALTQDQKDTARRTVRTILKRSGWTKGVSKNNSGNYCLTGAIDHAYPKGSAQRDYLYKEIRSRIATRKGSGYGIQGWNDRLQTTFDEVLEILE